MNAGRETAGDRLPGDPDKATLLAQMIRVDQAGEFGAKRIYEGQISVLGKKRSGADLARNARDRRKHT